MVQAPAAGWQRAGCDLALLIAVLQGCEQVLRGAGLQRSGDQLQRLLLAFLAQQRQRGGDAQDPGPARTPVQEIPRRSRPRGRRRIPGIGRPLE